MTFDEAPCSHEHARTAHLSTASAGSERTDRFRAARDLLLELRHDHDAAYERFRWPRFEHFNWALDWFDPIARGNARPALRIVTADGVTSVAYECLAHRSSQVANWLRGIGVRRGDRVLVMLDNQVEVWEVMLAAIKLGAVVVPTYTSATPTDVAERIERAAISHLVVTDRVAAKLASLPGGLTRVAVGAPVPGWLAYTDADGADAAFVPDAPTGADDPLFMYFTSGTTSRPKLAVHTHTSYPVGHLSGMYWNGLRPGDRHVNISAPGWAKHAWSSFFVPFNAEATLIAVNAPAGRFDVLLEALLSEDATSFCAPPTVWRQLIQEDLGRWPVRLREAGSVGEPLSPEVIEQVRAAWGVTVRDGFGQSETTAQIGNSPHLPLRPGSMGKPLPGYRVLLLDPETGREATEGELCVDLSGERPVGVMPGYLDDPEKNAATFAGGVYHTGDIAHRDADGYLTYVGRKDDVFKSYDHRISPFELESVLLEHPDVAEAAVVPVPDPIGLSVPKAFVSLAAGRPADADTARSVLDHTRRRLPPHQWIRLLEFVDLPKTTSGKIRRAELRRARPAGDGREFRADDLLGAGTTLAAPGMG